MVTNTNSVTSPTVTVTAILPTYNRGDYLAQALDSLFGQTRPVEEIIVVDDGSTDNTCEILEGYGEKIRAIFQANAGKPAALNKALPLARGSHIWLFDDDDVALPGALEGHERFLLAHPDIDFSCGRNYVFDSAGDIWQKQLWRAGVRSEFSPETLLIELMKQCNLVFQALLVPRRCFDAVGGFDESLLVSHDYDMLLKLARRFRGADNGQMSFVWRNHGGVRGPKHVRHANAERAAFFRKYERRIFTRIWEDFALWEYLPRRASMPAEQALTRSEAIAAQLQRCDIMFRHDLLAQAAHDLRDVLARIHTETEIAQAAGVIAHSADVEDSVFVATAGERARRMAWAIQGGSKPRLGVNGLKGFYWSVRRAIRQRRWHQALKLTSAGIVFTAGLVRRRPVDQKLSAPRA